MGGGQKGEVVFSLVFFFFTSQLQNRSKEGREGDFLIFFFFKKMCSEV